MKFASDLTSKTAVENDSVEFVLDDDVKVGRTVVVAKGAHAKAIVSHAHRAGMMGKGASSIFNSNIWRWPIAMSGFEARRAAKAIVKSAPR